MATPDQRREVAIEERQQQRLDVRAVHIGIGHDDDLAVAQVGQIRFVLRAMRIDSQRHGDVVDLGIGEQAVRFDFPGVLHLAAQRQDGLRFLVARHLRRAAGRIAFDQEEFVFTDVGGLAIGEFARQYRDAGLLALLHLLRVLLARQCLLDG